MAGSERPTRQRNDLGPIGEQVRANIKDLRGKRDLTTAELAGRLGTIGRPIIATGITKIESGDRRVDVGDLVALALALGVNPNRLLLPVADRREEVPLTPDVAVPQFAAWAWARGEEPALAAECVLGNGDRTWDEARDDFRRHALPPSERLRDDHTAVRAARDVLSSVRSLLERREHPEKFAKDGQMERILGHPVTSTVAGLRYTLNRLIAEVEALEAQEADRGDR